ncbi:UNVERIFIED_CONTAM: PH, RCC1 and FYVE domains-containing protein 1 [Sesamum latifolium]|uniref:PH, RCC1 and FYVE domains-containing protein 1 n=1 Tax=Sesamum latifolium TaxID=2727402 RepID=A0AAW2Y574_9LAMI
MGGQNTSKSFNPVFGSSKKFFSASVPGSRIVSRATSPISRRTSPPRSTTPTPTLGGLTSPKVVLDDAKMINDNLSQEVIKLRAQNPFVLFAKGGCGSLGAKFGRKSHSEGSTSGGRAGKDNKAAEGGNSNCREETAKCKAAKEVIKSLTAQLKEMAERLPVGSARNMKSPPFTPHGPSLSSDVSNASFNGTNGQINGQELEPYESNSLFLSNGSSTASNRSLVQNRQGNAEVTMRNGNRSKETDSRNENEWVEQDAWCLFTLTSLPGGLKDLKRVRFSRKRFSEKQAEQWWAENRARVYEQYNVRMVDKSSVGVGSEDLAH